MLQRVVSNRFEYAVCPAGDSDFTRGNDGISTPGEQAQTLRIGKKSLLHGSEENGFTERLRDSHSEVLEKLRELEVGHYWVVGQRSKLFE